MGDTPPVPPHLIEDVGRTVTRVFTEAISACDASSSLVRIDDIRRRLRDVFDAALAPPMRLHNARLSLQNRLPPEVWLNVWERLPMEARINISHVCSFWRELSVNSPDLWTALECTIGQPIPPKDPSPDFYSSLGLVTMALPRAKGRPLYLTISLHPVYMHGRAFDQLLAILRPHVGEIVEMDIRNCSLLEFLNMLGDLQPFPMLRHLHYGAITLQAYGPLPPVFSRPLQFPHLKTIVLPAERQYYWGWDSTISNGGGPVLCPREPPFPTVETVCFTPAHEADIAQVLHDCPSLKSLFLSLSDFPWNAPGSVDGTHSHDNLLTDLHLYAVRADHIQDAVGLYSSHSSTQHLSVMIRDLPRLTRVPYMRPGTPEIILQPWADDSYIPPWPPTPSLPPSDHSLPLEPAATDGAQTTSAGSRLPSGPKRFYRRLTRSAKGMFRKRTPEAQPQPEPSNHQSSPPVPPSIPPTPYPPDVTYDSTGLAHLSEIFRDLVDPVDVVLCTTSDGLQSSPITTHIALRATDTAGRTRAGGLRQSDSDAVPEFLAHVWRIVHPRHIACEVELFPLLIASLSEASPARSLEILFRTYYGPFGETAYCPMPAPMPMPQFPSVRSLRLAPRYAESAAQTVHSAGDIAAFVEGLGAELPLENVTICRGVIVEDPGALRELAESVLLHADPSRGLFRVPSSKCT